MRAKRAEPSGGFAPVFAAARGGAPKVPKASGWSVATGTADGTCMVRTDPGCVPSAKVAAFDMDGTLVVHRGSFATDAHDWAWFNPHVVPRLKALHASGYRLVVFSNQNGIKSALEGKRAATVKGYFDNAFRELGVPVTAFMAPQDDQYRKGGGTAMWRLFVRDHCAGVAPDLGRSFFVGDAAGRPADHGAGDKEFAAAVGLPFHLPETVFAPGWAIPWGDKPAAPADEDEVIVIT